MGVWQDRWPGAALRRVGGGWRKQLVHDGVPSWRVVINELSGRSYEHPDCCWRTHPGNRWWAAIRIGDGERWYLGTFQTAEEAAAAVRQAKAIRGSRQPAP